jgi:UDP-glucuronate 4-epimerase
VHRGATVTGLDNLDPFYDPAIKRENLSRVERVAEDGARSDRGAFRFVEADIRDVAAIRRAVQGEALHAVFHCAAMAGVRPSIDNPRLYSDVNITGLANVLEICRATGCRHMVFTSSSSVYGQRGAGPFSEEDLTNDPISPYAATKRAGELMCQAYARVYGMSIAAVRLFTVYGPAQRPDLAIARFLRLIAAGEEVPMYGDGTSSRDYTYIDDVIDGAISAWRTISSQHRGDGGFFRTYNLGSDRPVTLRQTIDAVAKAVGKPARVCKLPMQAGDVDCTWADLTRSRSELGYCPRTRFADGLSRQWDALTEARDETVADAPYIHTAVQSLRTTIPN